MLIPSLKGMLLAAAAWGGPCVNILV